MKTLVICNNPFDRSKERVTHTTILSKTVREWLDECGCADGILDGRPVICAVNGVPTLRKDWDDPLGKNDIVVVLPVVQDPIDIIIAIVVVIVSVVVSVALSSSQRAIPDAPSFSDAQAADSVFTLRGQQNQTKLSNPIERIYGTVRHWPSYAAAPYSRFIDNDSWLYQLFCVGHGKVRVEQIYIEDTPIESFNFVDYQIVEPGQSVTMFPDNVFTNTEVNGVELFGPNQTSYTGWTSNFVACPPLSTTQLIEIDLILTKGLYYANDDGSLGTRTVNADIQVRLIDDADTPAGSWTTMISFSKTLATNTPQRFTVSIPVAAGRYEVRAERTNNSDTSSRASDTLSWTALRAYLPSVQVYPGVTMLVVRAKATNNLNDNASNRINFTGTARIPVWDPTEGWINDIPTRSPVWAFCDVFRASYGGSLPDEFLDMQSLFQMDRVLAEQGIFFDWVFDSKSTTWEAAKAICVIARCVPMLVGSKITMIRDVPQVIPRMLFNENNIGENSLTMDIKLRDVQDNDGYEVEYVNPVTWQPETVLCLGPGDAGNNLKQVKVPGCVDRTRAFRIGMYMRMSELLVRSNITFKTGMEGLMISYGDLIAINHKFPRWGAGGYVQDISANGLVVTLSEPVTFTPGQTHYLLIRKRDGSVFGPSVVSQITPLQVVLNTPLDLASFFLDGRGEPPIYLFGYGTSWGKLAKVVNMQPQGDEEVTITATNYAPGIFSYDSVAPSASNAGFFLPQPSGTPTVNDLHVSAHPTDASLVIITWRSVVSVTKYVISTSTDGINFNDVVETPSPFYLLPVLPGHLWLRVSAVSTGAGVPATWDGVVGSILPLPGDVAGLTLNDWSGLQLTAAWTALTGSIDGYVVRMFTRSSGGAYKLARTVRVPGASFAYAYSDAVADNAVDREAKVVVTGVNITGESATPALITPVNALPAAATASYSSSFSSIRFSWTGDTSADVEFYRLIVYTTSGATTGDILYQGIDTSFDWSPPSGAFSSGFYWRVLTKDVWGPETVPSSEYHYPF